MNRELIIKLLAALGVKIAQKDEAGNVNPKEGELKEDDAVKLVEDLFQAGNLGLVQKRDELLGSEVKLKEQLKAFETGAAEKEKTLAALQEQLKKNNPEEYKNYYEGKAKELEAAHATALAAITAERDQFKNSHLERVKSDAIGEAIKGIEFLPGLQDGFIALAMTKNQFKDSTIDNKTVFTNQENKTLQAVLHELSLSKEGRAYIKNGNQGGGSGGSNAGQGSGTGGGNQISRTAFAALPDAGKTEFLNKGGTVVDG